jgi:hypothetical protein
MVSMIDQLLYSGPSFDDLHVHYAKDGRLDEKAPVKTAADILIQAPVESVWEHLINVQGWPAIDPSFRNVQLESTLAVDAYFKFVLNNFPIRAKIAVITPNRAFHWTGLSLWFKAVDLHVLEETADGGTRLYVAESFAGVMATLFISSEQLKRQHEKWLHAFKRALEDKNASATRSAGGMGYRMPDQRL